MNQLLKKFPLLAKVMLIGIVPFCFLVFFAFQLYQEKNQKLQFFENYKSYLAESANLSRLIDALQEERKFSFDYAITKSMHPELLLQRPRTDSLVAVLTRSPHPALEGFTSYTKLEQLSATRARIDSFKASPNDVMHFYSNTVFRLNTLNTLPPANTAYLQPVYQTLLAQKILQEMITYLGIIRSNIYNVLYTRKYMVETLVGTMGTYDVYNSYEKELRAKGAGDVLRRYDDMKNNTAFKPTISYIDTLFRRFSFDNSYTASTWWKVSDEGENSLRTMQAGMWDELDRGVSRLYNQEKKERDIFLVLLVLALAAVVFIITWMLMLITVSLKELRIAAGKIADGQTGVPITVLSRDAIGSLARSISIIDERNQALAVAATAIGQGDFSVPFQPRSDADKLGLAIAQMKAELQKYNNEMSSLVATRTEELARSNADLLQFAHVASHDLKEPLRKISIFSGILEENERDQLSTKGKLYLQKIRHASARMSMMIEGVLAYSMVETASQSTEAVDLNRVMEGVAGDLELAIIQKEARVDYGFLPTVQGIPVLLQQLFYNLVSNALKFSRVGVPPEVQIISEPYSLNGNHFSLPPGNYIRISISDNGIGFNPAYAEQMFAVFFRLNSKDQYEGTGLGLALCRKIVLRHKGMIYAESEEGEGAIFHVILPHTT